MRQPRPPTRPRRSLLSVARRPAHAVPPAEDARRTTVPAWPGVRRARVAPRGGVRAAADAGRVGPAGEGAGAGDGEVPLRRGGGARASARRDGTGVSERERLRQRRAKGDPDALVQLGKVADEVEVVGADDVDLVVERRRVCRDVDLARRLEQEGLVDRALLPERAHSGGSARGPARE